MINYGTLKDSSILEVLNLWNQSAIYDQMTVERFIKEVVADENFDDELTVTAFDNNQLVGFLIGVQRRFPYQERGTEPHRCFINMIAVKDSYRRKGIGREMLTRFENEMIDLNKTLITIGAYSPYYLYPGIDLKYKEALTLFKSHGYELYGDAVAMSLDLNNYTYPLEVLNKKEALENRNFTFEPFQYEDTYFLLKFLSEEFGGGWKKNAMDVIQKGHGPDMIIVCKNEQGEIIGSVQRSMDGHEGRFGPFGVDHRYRNHGLGTILFHEMMQNMLQNKIYYAYFLWSGGDAQRFYERQGMKVFREFKLCKKEFKEDQNE